MPIYEYRAEKGGCAHCIRGFDALQKMSDPPLAACPNCGAAVRRAVSRFCACTTDSAGDSAGLDSQIKDFESEGKWSHAAEMADKAGLQERAMDNYRKAGYNF